MIDTSGLKGEPVGSFYDFELVAGANAESVQHARRKGDLAFCSYFDNQGKSAESHWTTKYAKRREKGLEAVNYERYEMTRKGWCCIRKIRKNGKMWFIIRLRNVRIPVLDDGRN